MKKLARIFAIILSLAVTASASGASLDWLGGGADNAWNTSGNWSSGDTDPSGDALYFDATDMTILGTVNGVLDQDYAVGSMRFENLSPTADQGHTIEIGSGKSLTVSGNLGVGHYWTPPWPDNANENYVTAMFTGGGEMRVFGDLRVENSGASDKPATLDVSGLSQFTVDSNTSIKIGGRNNGYGILKLAENNTLRTPTLDLPGTGTSWAWPKLNQVLLGQQNTINADLIRLAGDNLNGEIRFQDGLTDPVAVLRDRSGTGRANLRVGDIRTTFHRDIVGTADFSGGSVDAMLGDLYVGIGEESDNDKVESVTGVFTMTAGLVDAEDVLIGRIADLGHASPHWTTGTVNIDGGLFTASLITLADDDSFDPTPVDPRPSHDNVRGTINLDGGTLAAGTIQKGDGNGTVELNFTTGTIANPGGADSTIAPGVPVTLLAPGAGSHVFDVEASQQITVQSVIEESGGVFGFTKSGDGKLVLEAANTYTGDTTVDAGMLAVDGSIQSDVLVNGGMVGGDGTIDGAVMVGGAGAVSAGGSPGELSITGDLDVLGSLVVELGGTDKGVTYDFVQVGGVATLDGVVDVDFVDGFLSSIGHSFDILQADGGISNGLETLAFDFSDAMNGHSWRPSIIPLGGGAELLRLQAVPEPSAVGLLLLGVASMVLGRRRSPRRS